MQKVSVIVPVYGVERFIGQCARTLFEQTYVDIEYVFVDDCTPDGSVATLRIVLGDYPQRASQVKIITHEKNRGSGAARLTGMQHATGDLVMFVDSDDYVDRRCVEKLVRRQQETGADIVDGAFSTFSGDTILSTTHPFPPSSSDRYLRAMLIHNTVTYQLWARIIRRAVFEEWGIAFVEGIDHAEDYSVMSRLLLRAKRECLDEIVYFYRYNDYGTFADGISSRHISSFIGANSIVARYIREQASSNRYETALQIGTIHTCYCALCVGVPAAEVLRQCGHPTLAVTKAALPLSCKRLSALLRLYYLIVKKIYKVTVLHITD